MTTNYSIFALPAYFLLSLLPHVYGTGIVKAGKKNVFDNANPRSTTQPSKIQQQLSPADFGRYERAEGAHKNGMENLPLFFSAIILGNMAQLPKSTLNLVAMSYLGSRVMYTLLYINIERRSTSFARSGTWAIGVGLCMYLISLSGIAFAKMD